MALKRFERAGTDGPLGKRSPESCEISVLYPTVMEFLSLQAWEDGTSRLTGTMTLMSDQGTLKAALNDKDAGLSCFVSARSLTGLLEALEKGLGTGSLEWRESKTWGSSGKRKGG